MRALLIASFVALLVLPAQAQGVKGVPRSHSAQERQTAIEKHKQAVEAEKSHKATIEKMPDKPFDPWRSSRGDTGSTGKR